MVDTAEAGPGDVQNTDLWDEKQHFSYLCFFAPWGGV